MTLARRIPTSVPAVETEEVRLRIPPYSEYLRAVRLVAADAAVRGGLDCDEVEDFRIAVDELAHLLMRSTDHEIEFAFGVVGRSVVARGVAYRRHGTHLMQMDELSRKILDSVAQWVKTSEQGSEIGFSVMKYPWSLAAQQ